MKIAPAYARGEEGRGDSQRREGRDGRWWVVGEALEIGQIAECAERSGEVKG
jgi:hypothetical protein